MNKCEASDRAELLILDVEKHNKVFLSLRNDLLILFETCYELKEETLIDDLSFTGKYLHSLINILKRGNDHLDEVALIKVKEEYTSNIKRITSMLEKIILSIDDKNKDSFYQKYLILNHQSLENISLLCKDLNYVKIYLNDKKHQGSN